MPTTDAAKASLFRDVRAGKVRILFGSTQKMGAGTNAQTLLVALHHLDAPWRPADIEQREGRILRQGNTNGVVKIFRYVTEGTFAPPAVSRRSSPPGSPAVLLRLLTTRSSNGSSSISQELDQRHPTTCASHWVTPGLRYPENLPVSETPVSSKPAVRPRPSATHSAPTSRPIDPIPCSSSNVTSVSSRQRCRGWGDAEPSSLVRNPLQCPRACGASVRAKSISQRRGRPRWTSP